ncbi:MAG: sugar ABC transporter permease [Pseudomonadota bacterium]
MHEKFFPKQLVIGWVASTLLVIGILFIVLNTIENTILNKTNLYTKFMDARVLSARIEAHMATDNWEDGLQERAISWQQETGKINGVRILKLSGAKVIVSTLEKDKERGGTYRLERKNVEHKRLYDQAKLIKSNYQSNRNSENLSEDKEIFFDQQKASTWIYLPLVNDKKFYGVLEIDLINSSEALASDGVLNTSRFYVLFVILLSVLLFPVFVYFYQKKIPYVSQRFINLSVVFTYLGLSIVVYSFFSDYTSKLYVAQSDFLTVLHNERAEELSFVKESLSSARNYIAINEYGKYLFSSSSIYPQMQAIDVGNISEKSFFINSYIAILLVGLGWVVFVTCDYASRTWQALKEHRQAYLYTAPAIIGMLLLVFFPFLYGLSLAFTNTTLLNESAPYAERWIGFDNFYAILLGFDLFETTNDGYNINYDNFYWTLFITICWTLLNVAIGVTVGLALALALNAPDLRFKAIYRVILILPWAIPNYVTSLVWKGMFHQQFGVINQIIQLFGSEPIAWFDSVFYAFITGIATNSWLSFPFMMVVILGGLQSIPADMYEAAKVEGASRWQQFRYITLPSLKPTLIPAVIISIVWTFNMFNIIFLVSGGEPAGANDILITKAYREAFEKYQYGYASAYSFVILAILLMYGIIQNKVSKATEANT